MQKGGDAEIAKSSRLNGPPLIKSLYYYVYTSISTPPLRAGASGAAGAAMAAPIFSLASSCKRCRRFIYGLAQLGKRRGSVRIIHAAHARMVEGRPSQNKVAPALRSYIYILVLKGIRCERINQPDGETARRPVILHGARRRSYS